MPPPLPSGGGPATALPPPAGSNSSGTGNSRGSSSIGSGCSHAKSGRLTKPGAPRWSSTYAGSTAQSPLPCHSRHTQTKPPLCCSCRLSKLSPPPTASLSPALACPLFSLQTLAETLPQNLFAISIVPYAGFLYHLHRSKLAPPLTLFGFYFLLVFVFATIPAGIYGE